MSNSKTFARFRGVLAFMIGIFGALAILGVFFKILKLNNYELFMKIGFIGEACAFVVMGVMELVTNFAHDPEHAAAADGGSAGTHVPLPSNFAKMVDAKLDARLDQMMANLATDIDHFKTEMASLSNELAHSAGAVRHMRGQLEGVASQDLAGDAHALGQGMAQLGTEMANAGATVEAMRSDLDMMLHRFRGFNTLQHPSAADHAPIAHRGRRAS